MTASPALHARPRRICLFRVHARRSRRSERSRDDRDRHSRRRGAHGPRDRHASRPRRARRSRAASIATAPWSATIAILRRSRGAADVLVDFTAPDALEAHLDAAVAAGTPIVIGTTGLRPEHHALIDTAAGKIAADPDREHLARRQSAARAGRGGGAPAGHRLGHRHRRDAPPRQARHALGHRAAARRVGQCRARRREQYRAQPLRSHAGGAAPARGGRHLLRLAARRIGSGRSHGDLRGRRRTHRTRPPRRKPRDLRQGRGQGGAVARRGRRAAGRYTMADVLGLT